MTRAPLALALLAAAAACDRGPRTVVAAPASPPPGPAAPAPVAPRAADAPVAKGPAAGAPGAAPGEEGAPPSHAELLARVEAMRAEVERREKPLEVLVALGNLYFENGRYADAIGWYGQALAIAEPGFRRWSALPDAVRAKAKAKAPCPSVAVRAGAAQPGYAELSAAADAREKKRDLAGAAACWRAALEPAVAARVQRANAYLLSGDPAKAIADHEAALAAAPDDPDALWFLGLALADSAQGDVAKLERARSLWQRLEQVQPRGPHQAELPVARAELERRIATALRGK